MQHRMRSLHTADSTVTASFRSRHMIRGLTMRGHTRGGAWSWTSLIVAQAPRRTARGGAGRSCFSNRAFRGSFDIYSQSDLLCASSHKQRTSVTRFTS